MLTEVVRQLADEGRIVVLSSSMWAFSSAGRPR